MTKAIDLSPAEPVMVREILGVHLPTASRVWVFGSRAPASAWRYSDLDLALENAEPPSLDILSDVTEALLESDLPYRADVLGLRSIDQSFRAVIEADMIEFPR